MPLAAAGPLRRHGGPRREVIAALRAAGFEGPYEGGDEGDHLLHAGDGAFDLREAYDNLAGLPAVDLPLLEIVQSPIGGETMTVTRWKSGAPCALPNADAMVFERGEEMLGIASWDAVA